MLITFEGEKMNNLRLAEKIGAQLIRKRETSDQLQLNEKIKSQLALYGHMLTKQHMISRHLMNDLGLEEDFKSFKKEEEE